MCARAERAVSLKVSSSFAQEYIGIEKIEELTIAGLIEVLLVGRDLVGSTREI